MKSKTSFFNKGLSLSLLRRSWPVWTSYFVLLLIAIPGSLMQIVERAGNYEHSIDYVSRNLNQDMLRAGAGVATLSFFACILVAMAMFSFMYNNRSTSMYCSMPIKRETVFSTAFLTGLVPMLITDILIALICLGFVGEGLEAKNVWLFMSMAVMGNIAFYGMAAFCAVLTGHILVLPAVYAVLNVAVYLAENGVHYLRQTVVYGYSESFKLQAFSPIAQLMSKLSVQTQYVRGIDGGMRETGEYLLKGYEWLIVYCIVGLVLAVLALLIYRRRQMETCGDVVAIPILKPIFRYCMCFGVSLMFATVVYDMLFESYMRGSAEALCYLALLLVGAFIGYFTAEMLIQKTLRVFRGKWKGFLVSALIICVFLGANELDVFGYESRQPDIEDVEYVWISYFDGCTFKEPENIEQAYDFHRLLIEEKHISEYSNQGQYLDVSYHLKNGEIFDRHYLVSLDYAQQRDENSAISTFSRLVNLQEAIDSRAATVVPVELSNILDAQLEGHKLNDKGEWEYFSIEMTDQQAYDFYYDCIVPDAAEGKLCRLFPVNNEEYYSMATPVSFHFGQFYEMDKIDDYYHSYKSFTMYLDAQRCCRWIEENTDIELVSMAEYDPEGMEATFKELELCLPVSTKEAPVAAVIHAPHP